MSLSDPLDAMHESKEAPDASAMAAEKKAQKKKKRSREEATAEEEGVPAALEAALELQLEAKEKAREEKKKKSKLAKEAAEEGEQQPASSEQAPDANGNPHLSTFPIPANILSILKAKGITHAFPIQSSTFHPILDGEDVVGRARTGTGKTLAFALPIVLRLTARDLAANRRLSVGRAPRVLALTPTRELAKQVCETFEAIAPALVAVTVYGGAPYPPMEAALRRGCDVVVGTCGRVSDLLERGALKLDKVEVIILDEADEMLDMGFADDIEKILQSVPRPAAAAAASSAAPATVQCQTLLFSATLPDWVQNVSKKYLRANHRKIDLVGSSAHKASSDVQHYAIACHWSERNTVMKEVINVYGGEKARTIVFTETKKEANEIASNSSLTGLCGVLHGDIAQAQREITLKGFREGRFSVLIATDVAARGIDIAGVELVIQCEPPGSVETYIHRSGRTGRAGTKGVAVTFFTPKQLWNLAQIERVAKVKFVRTGVPQRDDIYATAAAKAVKELTSVHRDVVPHFLTQARLLLESAAFMPSKGDKDKEKGKEKKSKKRKLEHEEEKERDDDEEDDSSSRDDDGEEADIDPAYALAAALACISGHKQPVQARSLLLSTSGWTTVHYTSPFEVRSLSFVWAAIRKHLFTGENESDDKVRGIKITLDKRGAVFDIPSDEEDKLKALNAELEANPREKQRFIICKALPALPAAEMVRPEPRWRGGGGRSSFGGSGRGGSSRGAGRGGSSSRGRFSR